MCSLSDGGDGFVDCLSEVLNQKVKTHSVRGPYFEPTNAKFLILENKEAVIEVASSCGMETTSQRDVMNATSQGLGELISHLHHSCQITSFLIGVGGSAFSEMGIGALQSLGLELTPPAYTPN